MDEGQSDLQDQINQHFKGLLEKCVAAMESLVERAEIQDSLVKSLSSRVDYLGRYVERMERAEFEGE